jgi:hypothetical protein
VSQETSVTYGSVWLGGGVGGCRIVVGGACIGVVGSAATDVTGPLARRDVAGLVAADLTRGRANWAVRVGLAAGVGYSQNELHSDSHGVLTADGFDVRLREQVTGSRALGGSVAVDLSLAFEQGFFARSPDTSAHVTDPGPADRLLRIGLALRFGGLGWER